MNGKQYQYYDTIVKCCEINYQQCRSTMPKVKFVRIFNPSPCTVVFAPKEQVGCRHGWIALLFVLWPNADLIQFGTMRMDYKRLRVKEGIGKDYVGKVGKLF